MPIKSHLQRIVSKDMKSIIEHDLESSGIFVTFNETDITQAHAMIIGPKGSCYEDGLLYFKIEFPTQYPHVPPKILYLSRGSIRIHPNLYRGRRQDDYLGKVCLSLLGTWQGPGWTSIMDITSILLTIQSLLTNDPLTKEPGYTNSTGSINERYNTCVQYETLQTLILKNALDIPYGLEEFKPFIIKHFKENFESILQRYSDFSKKNGSEMVIQVSIYNINMHINYSKLLEIYNCEMPKLLD